MIEGATKLRHLGDDRREVDEPQALGDVRAGAATEDGMVDERVLGEARSRPRPACAPAEPDVLAERLSDPRLQPILESAEAIEELAATEQARALVEAPLADDPDGAVERRGDRGGVGVHRALDEIRARERLEPGLEPAGRGDAVGVGERERLAGGDRDPGVARRPGTHPSRAHEPDGQRRGLGDRGGVVCGAVVDDDHLELGGGALGGERRERRAEGRGGVAGRDDDAGGDHGADKLVGRYCAG